MVKTMNHMAPAAEDDLAKPILPGWIMGRSAPETLGSMTLESAGFASGSALALLHVALHDPNTNVPTELLTQRLALRAAVQCLKLQGRADTEGEIRDAYLLSEPDAEKGPGGDMLAFWKAGMSVSLRQRDWQDRLIGLLPEEMREDAAGQLNSPGEPIGQGPVEAAIAALISLLQDHPREEAAALLITDILLAKALGWAKSLPLIAHHLKRPDLRGLLNNGDREGFRIACHVALASGAQDAVRLAYDLARRRARLEAVAPKLRAKGSDDAVALFLKEDAIFPTTMLSPVIKGTRTKMSDHAARRLCDRLIELGAVRELTGRSTFRIYGV